MLLPVSRSGQDSALGVWWLPSPQGWELKQDSLLDHGSQWATPTTQRQTAHNLPGDFRLTGTFNSDLLGIPVPDEDER